jgi:hypothetical protein
VRTPEGYEKDKICKFLDTLPRCFYFRAQMGPFGRAGIPDIVACIKGDFWSIEVKRPGAVATPRQNKRMDQIRNADGKTVCGDSAWVINHIKTLTT